MDCTKCKYFFINSENMQCCNAYHVMCYFDVKSDKYPCEKPKFGLKFMPKSDVHMSQLHDRGRRRGEP